MMNQYYEHSWGFGPWWIFGFGVLGVTLFLALIVAVIVLKGYALWHAAKRDEKGWFVALLIVNTFGILELIYLHFVVKKWNKKNPTIPSEPMSKL